MARFEVIDHEGVSFLKVTLDKETIRAERGALCYLFGDIEVDAKVPSVGRAIKRLLAHESVIWPSYTGSGTVYLESSLESFHVFDLDDTAWILNRGSYWASEGSVELGLHRETLLTSYFGGEGLIELHTKVSGRGKVVLRTWGPVEEVALNDEQLVTDGRYVLARTSDVRYRIKTAARSLVAHWLSGETRLRVYEGTGRILLASYPFWRTALLDAIRKKRLP
jgi:uncharacterized protein (AIM24 family)